MELGHRDEGIDSDNREIVDDNKENDSFGLRGNQVNLFLDLCLRVPFGIGFVNSKKCLKKLIQNQKAFVLSRIQGDFYRV